MDNEAGLSKSLQIIKWSCIKLWDLFPKDHEEISMNSSHFSMFCTYLFHFFPPLLCLESDHKASLFTVQTFFFLSGLTDCLLLSNWVIWLISASDFLRCWVLFFHKLKSGFLCLGTFPLFSPSFFWTVCTGCLFLFMYLLFFPTLQEEHCHKEITSPLLSVTSGQETVLTASGFSPKFSISILVAFNKPPQSEVPSCLMKLVCMHQLTRTQIPIVQSAQCQIEHQRPDGT